jgi:hypothetical protein
MSVCACKPEPAAKAIEILSDSSKPSDLPPETPSMESVFKLDKMIDDVITKVDIVNRRCYRDSKHQISQIRAASKAMEQAFNYALNNFRAACIWIPTYNLKQAREDLKALRKSTREENFFYETHHSCFFVPFILEWLKHWKKDVVPKVEYKLEAVSQSDKKEETIESLVNENAALKDKLKLLEERVSRLEEIVKRVQSILPLSQDQP